MKLLLFHCWAIQLTRLIQFNEGRWKSHLFCTSLHTCEETLQLKNKWLWSSFWLLHSRHRILGSTLNKRSCVPSLPCTASQRQNTALGILSGYHTSLCHSTCSFRVLTLSHADLIENFPDITGSQITSSCSMQLGGGWANMVYLIARRSPDAIQGHLHWSFLIIEGTFAFLDNLVSLIIWSPIARINGPIGNQ